MDTNINEKKKISGREFTMTVKGKHLDERKILKVLKF